MAEELDGMTEETSQNENKEITLTVETVDFDAFKGILNKYVEDFSRLIRIYKSKDETISKLSAEVTRYRGDFVLQLKKPVWMSLISYREDCRKTLANLAQYAKDAESVKTYCDYLVSDLEEIMITFGLEANGDVFTLNGVKLTDCVPCKIKAAAPEEESETVEKEKTGAEESETDAGSAKMSYSFETLLEIIDDGRERVENLLKDCAKADDNLKHYVDIAASIEQNYSDSILLPLYKSIAALHNDLKMKVEEVKAKIDEDNKAKLYAEPLKLMVDKIERILTDSEVNVEHDVTNVYDNKTCKTVKVVNTDDAELDKTVAKRHSDCYGYENKVLYPSRVEVYKYVPKKD